MRRGGDSGCSVLICKISMWLTDGGPDDRMGGVTGPLRIGNEPNWNHDEGGLCQPFNEFLPKLFH